MNNILRFSLVFSSNNTLWGSLEEPNITNTNEFEDLFSKATLQPKKKPLLDTYEKKAKTKKVNSLSFKVWVLASQFFLDPGRVEIIAYFLFMVFLQPPEGVISFLSSFV